MHFLMWMVPWENVCRVLDGSGKMKECIIMGTNENVTQQCASPTKAEVRATQIAVRAVDEARGVHNAGAKVVALTEDQRRTLIARVAAILMEARDGGQ